MARRRDSQRSKVYRWENSSQSMAGGDRRYTTPSLEWKRADLLDDELVNAAAESYTQEISNLYETVEVEYVLVPRFDPQGRPLYRYRRNTPHQMTLAACQDLADRVTDDFGLPRIPVTDGRGRRKAALRWRQADPTGWAPIMRNPNGLSYAVSLALPKWSRSGWSCIHEISHYVSLAYMPGIASHGPEFTGVMLDLLELYLDIPFDRQAAEAAARRRKVKFDPNTLNRISEHITLQRPVNARSRRGMG